jgi:outer membrane protein assembly factor BamB
MFARDAKTGRSIEPATHWTTTLVDPDFDHASVAVAPDLFYTAVSVTEDHVWVLSSVYGRLHAVERHGGAEVDFDCSTPEIDPLALAPDRAFTSSLGEPIIFETTRQQGSRTLFVAGINVILNDALVQGRETGLMIALDITDPYAPFEVWRTPTIDINPETGRPFGTGVSAGSGLALDRKRRLLYGGTGQNTTEPYAGYPNPDAAPAGYIDRGDALFAIDYVTGQFVWVNQFHSNDVFDLNNPVPTGPGRTDGPRDADVLVPPILFRAGTARGARDLVAGGSKGGLFRAVDRETGQTIWQRQVSQPSGLGGIQAGAAVAKGFIYVAAFEGLDEGWSDANFNAPGSTYLNAFFATFAPAFWADVEDVRADDNPATGARTKLYKLDAGTGYSAWSFPGGRDYVDLPAGVCLRHVSVANDVVFVTTSSGRLFAVDSKTGSILFSDQTLDLNAHYGLGLGKPHHAPMNGGALISDGMVYVPYGGQNEPSGGIIAYEVAGRK